VRVLGFDYGTKKIGVAIGQSVTKTANPLPLLKSGDALDWSVIDKHIKEWKPDCLVVGLPLSMKGEALSVTPLAEAFKHDLAKRYPDLVVHSVDERLSTQAAKEAIFERYGYKGLKSKDIDGLAACLLIEQWMKQYV
jgi:putative Holliday junction resolvase